MTKPGMAPWAFLVAPITAAGEKNNLLLVRTFRKYPGLVLGCLAGHCPYALNILPLPQLGTMSQIATSLQNSRSAVCCEEGMWGAVVLFTGVVFLGTPLSVGCPPIAVDVTFI